MPSILSELYRGSYNVMKCAYHSDTAFARNKLCTDQENLEEEIINALPDEKKYLFKQYLKVSSDLNFASSEEDFIEGFRLGVRLMIAALCPEPSAAE